MRTKNNEDVVHQALAGLHAQAFRDFELIVIDSGSTDRTIEMVRSYPCKLIQIRPEEYYPGPVLNRAAARACGEVLVFQNSDVVPLTSETLGRLVAPFADAAVQATFARQLPRPEAHTWVRRDYEVAFPAQGEAPAWLPFSLPLAAMRRSAWARRPFYDAAWGSEDTEWGVRARAAGEVVRYVPDALVMHSHNYTLRQLVGRRFIEGEADAFIFGGAVGALASLGRWARSMAADVRAHWHAGDLAGMLAALPRRAVYHHAYWRGRAHGARRQVRGGDASFGQRMVLSRYEA
jgi:rhamnosyltransferase